MSENEYTVRVRAAIAAGRRFREELRLEPERGMPTMHFYSDRLTMAEWFVISPDATTGWFVVKQNIKTPSAAGDGRVLSFSAKNETYGERFLTQRIVLQEIHASLLKDSNLLRFLVDNVVTHQAVASIKAIAAALQDPRVRKALTSHRVVIDPSVPLVTGDSELLEAQIKVSIWNSEIVSPGAVNRGDLLASLGQREIKKNTELSTALLESALRLGGLKGKPFLLKELTNARTLQGRITEAAAAQEAFLRADMQRPEEFRLPLFDRLPQKWDAEESGGSRPGSPTFRDPLDEEQRQLRPSR